MNVSQANHPFQQQSHPSDSTPVVSDLLNSEGFLNQLRLAQQGDEWYTRTDVRAEKKRVYEEQQTRRRKAADHEDDLLAGLASQGYVNDLKQSRVGETARVMSAAENRDRLMQQVEKKHLHTPAIAEDVNPDGAESGFSRAMAQELEGETKGRWKEPSAAVAGKDAGESADMLQPAQTKNSDAAGTDVMRRYDATLVNGMKPENAAKTASRFMENTTGQLSRLNAADTAGTKAGTRPASAKTISLSGLASTAAESRRTESDLKVAAPQKPQTPVNIKDVAGNVRIMISGKSSEMVMKLVPEHLGKLEIRLKKEGDKLFGKFKVESRQAKEAIDIQLPQLREGLAQQGIHLEEITVFVGGEEPSDPSFAFNQGHDGKTGPEQRPVSAAGNMNSGTHAAETTSRRSISTDSGLNIYA